MPQRSTRRRLIAVGAAALAATTALVVTGLSASSATTPKPQVDRSADTASPIKHLVVIFDENVSYDHYFGTYPKAANTDGTRFYPVTSTPKNNNLVTSGNLTSNPNSYYPQRLTPSEAVTCDQNHNYGPEQKAADSGKMDQFPQNVSVDGCATMGAFHAPGLTMDYYDGNTVTALWNYAQQYSLSDNTYDTTFGPSTPGALNLVSGQTRGFREVDSVTHQKTTDPYTIVAPDANGVGTVVNDPDPAYDDCSDNGHAPTNTNTLAAATGKNVGDLLNARGVSWGWFQGGFAPTGTANGYAQCGATHTNVAGASVVDYSAHHNPFEYYQSTSNPKHLAPVNLAEVGHNGRANHEYDLSWFDKVAQQGKLPGVSFVKAAEYQDGHAGYSDPIDEQHFLVRTINELESGPQWASTAVVIAYDDSDGWYDHQFIAPKSGSDIAGLDSATCSAQTEVTDGYQGRCGPGPRLPLLVISPWAKTNYVGHRQSEQASITKFIEDNWFTGRLGGGSFDQRAGTLTGLLDFTQSNNKRVLLKSDGSVKSITPISSKRAMRATAVRTH